MTRLVVVPWSRPAFAKCQRAEHFPTRDAALDAKHSRDIRAGVRLRVRPCPVCQEFMLAIRKTTPSDRRRNARHGKPRQEATA